MRALPIPLRSRFEVTGFEEMLFHYIIVQRNAEAGAIRER